MLLAGLCLLCLGLIAVQPAAAKGKRNIDTGFVTWRLDDVPRMKQSGAAFVRINVRWDSIAPTKPILPKNPADPAYDFSRLDAQIKAAKAGGLTPILTIFAAPRWAEGAGRPPDVEPGAWVPNPQAYGDFTQALAKRYSGSYPLVGPHLPAVRYYEIWNEPNLAIYLAPQWKDGRPFSPTLYANLLNAAYKSIKSVSGKNRVIGGVTAPYGFTSVGKKMAPILFLRNLFCVHKAQRCAPKPHLNILSHHPINRQGSPTTHGPGPLDVSVPDLGRIKRIVRAAAQRHSILPGGTVPLWITEFWWESNPPDRKNGVPIKKQAHWIEQALYLFWRAGSPVALNLQVRDSFLPNPDVKPLSYQAGIFYDDGRKKPSYTAFTFPFVSDRKSKRRVLVWGKAPRSGKLKIQVRKKHRRHRRAGVSSAAADAVHKRAGHGGWRTVKRIRVHDGKVFTTKIRLKGHAKIRGALGHKHTLTWRQR